MTQDHHIEDAIIAALRRIIRAVDLHSRCLVGRFGLTGPQLAVLREAARVGKARIGSLARAVRLSQGTVTGIVGRLEQRKLLERVRDGADRRTVNVAITTAGRELLERAPSLLQDRFREELAKLPEWQRGMTLASLQHIAEMMEADTLRAPGTLSPELSDEDVEASLLVVAGLKNDPRPQSSSDGPD